ncbi:Retrovirus-related Pol polyprotein from transposon opus, partial [Mucuna pruriens]
MPFPTRTISTRKLELDEELLKLFHKVEMNIPLLNAIKQIPKYAKFLKELCVHKRKKVKESVEVEGIVLVLSRNDEFTTGVLEDVLVQVNDLIYPTDFYVLDMEDEASGKGITLILGRPFLMTAKIKIDVHAGTLSMEFGDTLVQFNIFEAMKHPIEDHSLFGIDLIDKLVEEYLQLDSNSEDNENFVGSTDLINFLGNKQELNSLFHSNPTPRLHKDLKPTPIRQELNISKGQKAEIISAPCSTQTGQSDLNPIHENSSSPPPSLELKPLPIHLKYAYLDNEQQFLVIIANNLHREQENKLLNTFRQHKKAIGWKLSDLPNKNPSICMHRIFMEEEFKPIRQQQRRLNLIILDVVKKEVTKLLAVGIIYPILDSQWVSPVQVVSKKSGTISLKNYQENPTIVFWMDSHYTCRFTLQLKISTRLPSPAHLALLRTVAYHLACVMLRVHFSIDCMEVFMDDFTVYADLFDACLENLSKVLRRCIDTNLVLNCEKCHFMVIEGIVLGHLVSNRGIEVDKSKIDIISSLPNPASMREVRSFLGHARFYRRFIKNFSKLALPLSKLLQKDVDFNFDQPCIEAFQELKSKLTSAPIL